MNMGMYSIRCSTALFTDSVKGGKFYFYLLTFMVQAAGLQLRYHRIKIRLFVVRLVWIKAN